VTPREELIAAARAARGNAYAPYSRFAVGAALRAEDGRVYVGANVENAAYPAGQCAEASAIGAMVTAGGRRILEIAVVGSGPEPCTPCGGCRQRLREFAAPGATVHAIAGDGAVRTFTIEELLPASFGPDTLGLPKGRE
jgi:cytidine deaminase